jgi:hypothetical protein
MVTLMSTQRWLSLTLFLASLGAFAASLVAAEDGLRTPIPDVCVSLGFIALGAAGFQFLKDDVSPPGRLRHWSIRLVVLGVVALVFGVGNIVHHRGMTYLAMDAVVAAAVFGSLGIWGVWRSRGF